MSSNKNEPDQPGLWDELGENKPAGQRSRCRRPSASTAPDAPAAQAPNAPAEADRHLWSVDDVAAFLGVPKKTIYAWRTTGKGPKGFRVGKHLRWHPRTVFEWLLQLEGER